MQQKLQDLSHLFVSAIISNSLTYGQHSFIIIFPEVIWAHFAISKNSFLKIIFSTFCQKPLGHLTQNVVRIIYRLH